MEIVTDDEASKMSNPAHEQDESSIVLDTSENEQVEDELKRQFEQLELDEKAMTEKVQEFQAILNHPRLDDQAFKIKEQVIYR